MIQTIKINALLVKQIQLMQKNLYNISIKPLVFAKTTQMIFYVINLTLTITIAQFAKLTLILIPNQKNVLNM